MARKKSLGFGFVDEVAKVTSKNSHFYKNVLGGSDWKEMLIPNFEGDLPPAQVNLWRLIVLWGGATVLFFILFLRLFHLQIVMGQENRERADGNRIQVRIVHAPRGVIYDRNGKILASNSPGFRLISKGQKATVISREEALEMEVRNDPELEKLEVDSIRGYPYGEEVAHVLGYVSEISESQLENLKDKGYDQSPTAPRYKAGDRIGISGIESQYEAILRGKDGGEIIEVNSSGKKLRTLRFIDPIPGRSIFLTIDIDLQRHVFKALRDSIQKVGSCCGVAVAEDPNTGQILALISIPSFDNSVFTSPTQNEGVITEILSDPNSPILNRAIGGNYPPGSTYKIVSALSALSSGKISSKTIFEDTGEIYLGQFRFTNWYFTQYGKTEGSVNLVKALKRSNDIYFYRVGQVVGEKSLIDWSKKLNLGAKLGIDLPGEVSGLIPDNEWKKKNFGEIWYPGDTLHMAIGQGFVLTTPLQILGITSYVAGNGNLYKPKLLLKTETEEFDSKTLVSKLITTEHLDVIKHGLAEVTKVEGTAWPFFTFPIQTSGKTGTAEFGDPKDRTHAWYTGFAPTDDPKIAMTVLIEAGGEGSSVAAPVVKEAFRWFFSPDKNNLIKDTGYVATDSARTLGE